MESYQRTFAEKLMSGHHKGLKPQYAEAMFKINEAFETILNTLNQVQKEHLKESLTSKDLDNALPDLMTNDMIYQKAISEALSADNFARKYILMVNE